jgi:RNA polymerase sigma-70 factor (ECF subfamily)
MAEPRGRLYLVRDAAKAEPRDADLVAAYLRKDVWAPAAIWGRYYPLVRRIAFRASGPGRDVDDIVQEVFLRLFRRLPGLRDPAALRAFVLAITVRVIKGDQRVRWLKRWLGLFQDGDTPEDLDDDGRGVVDHEAREALGRFYAILDRLSPKHRTAFVLRYVENLELSDVAIALGVSLATIKRWLPRIAQRVFAQAKGDPALAPYLDLVGGSIGGQST